MLALGLAAALAAAAGPGTVIDYGQYKVYQRSRALGTETFEFLSFGDSIKIVSHVVQTLPGPDGDLPIDKQAWITLGTLDSDLRFYQSTLKVKGRDLTRGLVMHDTAFTAYRETNVHGTGEGTRFLRPPGRFYVLDGQVFVLFDVMCRDLAKAKFKSRPVSVVLLRDGDDQVTQITVTDMGPDSIRWAAKPMMARKLRFADAYSTFHAWIGPLGYMVRLEQDGSGLRVERDPPAVKRQAQPTPR
jgi:hypothetical protein